MVSLHEGEKVSLLTINNLHIWHFQLHLYVRNLSVLVCFLLQIVKFCLPGQDRVSAVSDVDIGIYQLQRSEKLLGERVEKLGLEADK